MALDSQNRYREGELEYRQAIKLNPDNSDLHYFLGRALSKQDRHPEAEAALRQAVNLNPGSSKAHFGLGRVLESQDRHAEAEAAYRTATELSPSDASNHKRVGDMLARQKRYDDAETAYKKALSIEPDNGEIRNSLQSLTAQRQAETAKEHGGESLTKSPDKMSLEARKGFDTGGSLTSGPSPVDTRGVAPVAVPERIANHPKYKELQSEENVLVKQRETLETELAAIREQKKANAGSKGQYEVQEAKKKQQIANVTNQIGVTAVKKKDFIVSFQEEEDQQPEKRKK